VRALGLIGDARGAQAVRQAFEATRSEGAFADVLAMMFGHGALEELLELAESDDPVTRRAVCDELVRLASPRAAETVAALLMDPDPDVRLAAREAVARTADEEIVAEVIAGLEAPSPDAREFTVSLLPITLAWSD
jgi:HEAT repeat protein